MASNAEKLKTLCTDTLTRFEGTTPYAYNGRPQFGTFQLPLEVVRHAPELHFDDAHMGRTWMAVPSVAQLNRQRLKVRHHVVDDPHFTTPKKNRQIVPPTRGGIKLRDVNTIMKEQEETKGMSEEQIRRYRESKRQSSPQRRLQQQQQTPKSTHQKAVNPVEDFLKEITQANAPRSAPPTTNHKNINNNNNNNNHSINNNNSTSKSNSHSQKNRGPLGHRATSSDSSSSSNSTPSRNHTHHHPNHTNPRGTTSTSSAVKKSVASKVPPSSTTTINNNNKRKSSPIIPDLFVTKIYLLDTHDKVETRKISDLKRSISQVEMHEKQDNVVTKRPRLLLHIKAQQQEEKKKTKKVREKTKTSKATSKMAASTEDVNFVPSVNKQPPPTDITTTSTPRKSKSETKPTATPKLSTIEPTSSSSSPKPPMTNGTKYLQESKKETNNNHKSTDILEKRKSETVSVGKIQKQESKNNIEKSSHRSSSSSNAEFLKSTRIPKRKQPSHEEEQPRSQNQHNMDRELEEGETISPSPSPRGALPVPAVTVKPEPPSSSPPSSIVEEKEKAKEKRRPDRSISPHPKERLTNGTGSSNPAGKISSSSNHRVTTATTTSLSSKKEDERVSSSSTSSSSKRSSRRAGDEGGSDERRRTTSDRREGGSNNRLRVGEDEEKKRRSEDRSISTRERDRSVDDRKRHRRESRQSSIPSSSDRHRRRSRSPPSTSKNSNLSSSSSRAYKRTRSRSPRPAKSRSRSPLRARSHSSTRRSSPERERRTSSSSSSTVITKETDLKPPPAPPAPIYKNATSPDSETEQQCKMYALMFRKLATAYKHRGDPRIKEITGLIDHMHGILNYVLSFYYQDKKPDKYQSLAHWESLYPFASIVMRHLQSKREMQLYAVCANVMAMVRFYTFRRRETIANKKLDPLLMTEKTAEAASTPIKASVAHDSAKLARQALTDFEEAYKLYKEADKHMNQEQFKEQFPKTQKTVIDQGEYGPGIVIGGEAGITIEPRYPFVPFAKLHHAAIVAKCVLHEYLQKHHLEYTPISDTDDFM
ncbi:hypothetical protein BDA99DRAFT_565451 [Phascolomyces articulosus]|uniref:Uncharacterized protein n=1 Tax=Phascolomyces articulosus TaxID=60185 RepID=A0AAD5P888_9FUNG|nr:hypothetical protein BDA99DRAFT_565451 [Phascolomyces articulosus]